MSENPYQPPQTISRPTYGLTQLLAYSASINLMLQRVSINLVSLQSYFLVFGGIAIAVAGLIVYRNDLTGAWIFLAIFSPFYFLLAIAAAKHNIIFTATEPLSVNTGSNEIHIPTDLFVSGKLRLDEVELTRFQRLLKRLMTGRSANHWYLRVPCQLQLSTVHPQLFGLISHLDPSRHFLGINLEHRGGLWNATGIVNALFPHQLGLLHRGNVIESAAKIGYVDQFQRRRWIIISTPDHDAILDAVTAIMRTTQYDIT